MSKKLYPEADINELVDSDLNPEETFYKGGPGSGIKGHKTYNQIPDEVVKQVRQQFFDTGKTPKLPHQVADDFAVRLRNNGYPVKAVAEGEFVVLINPNHESKAPRGGY